MGTAVAIVSAVSAVAGTALTVAGAAQQGQAQAAAQRFQAQQMELQQQEAVTQGAQQEAARRNTLTQNLDTIVSFYGSRDVSGDSPSVQAMMDNTEALGMQDIQVSGLNASMAAANAGLQATEDQSAIGSDLTAGYLNAGGSLLSGASSTGLSIYKETQPGGLLSGTS